MLAHAGGAATLDTPPWLLAYGAAAAVLLVTVTLRGRVLVAGVTPAPDRSSDDDGLGPRDRPGVGGRAWVRARIVGRVVGRAVGGGTFVLVVAAAFAGPEASAANLAPSAVLGLWWAGLPLACLVVGDVMRLLDPFGSLAALVPGARRRNRGRRPPPSWASWTAPAMLGAAAWWVLAYHDGRSPRPLGGALVVYAVAAVAGVTVWGDAWLRSGEGFGALSSALARVRRPGRASRSRLADDGVPDGPQIHARSGATPDPGAPQDPARSRPTPNPRAPESTAPDGDPPIPGAPQDPARSGTTPNPRGQRIPAGAGAGGAPSRPVLGGLVAVWLGAVAFDMFSGTRAWVELAGTTSGWARTGRASACLLAAVALAGLAVAVTARLAGGRLAATGAAAAHRADDTDALDSTGDLGAEATDDPVATYAGAPDDTVATYDDAPDDPVATYDDAPDDAGADHRGANDRAPAAPNADHPDANDRAPAPAADHPGANDRAPAANHPGADGRPATPVAAEAVTLGWLAATAGAVVAHGIPVLLLEGQFALALVSDPFGRGWDLFGTARRTVDYSPLSPGLVGTTQVLAAAAGAVWGVVAAWRTVWPTAGPLADARAARRVLWVTGVALAAGAASAVGALSADLE